jgi:hypothetical protein
MCNNNKTTGSYPENEILRKQLNARPGLHALPHHKESVTGLALVYKR